MNKDELRKVVSSGGAGGCATAASLATSQHDVMVDLIHRPGAVIPAAWVKLPSNHELFSDPATKAAAALSFEQSVFSINK